MAHGHDRRGAGRPQAASHHGLKLLEIKPFESTKISAELLAACR
jgi:hypothetical protein